MTPPTNLWKTMYAISVGDFCTLNMSHFIFQHTVYLVGIIRSSLKGIVTLCGFYWLTTVAQSLELPILNLQFFPPHFLKFSGGKVVETTFSLGSIRRLMSCSIVCRVKHWPNCYRCSLHRWKLEASCTLTGGLLGISAEVLTTSCRSWNTHNHV